MSDDNELPDDEPEDGSEWDNRNTGQDNSGKRKRGRPKDPLVALRRDMRRELEEMMLHDAPSVYKVVKDAYKKGDLSAAKIVLDHVAPRRRGREAEFEMPSLKSASDIGPAMDAVLAHVANGVLTVEEGEKIMQMFSARIKAFEASEVMVEVRKLQETMTAQIAAMAEDRAQRAREARDATKANGKVPPGQGKAWPGIQPGRA